MHRGIGCNPANVFDIAIYMALKRGCVEEKAKKNLVACVAISELFIKKKPSWKYFIAPGIHESASK